MPKFALLYLFTFLLIGCTNKDSSISGTIKFDHLYIHQAAMNVYAKNVKTGQLFQTSTAVGSPKMKGADVKFVIEDLPAGTYVVYAYSKESVAGEYVSPEKVHLYGAYTKAAHCRWTAACKDHKLIELELKAGHRISKVVIGDWFFVENQHLRSH